MHNEWEENYQRGYEWWLMKEAKKVRGVSKITHQQRGEITIRGYIKNIINKYIAC